MKILLLDQRIVRVRRLLHDLANRAGEIEAGAHGERHQVDHVGKAAGDVLEPLLADAADLHVRHRPAERDARDRADAAEVARPAGHGADEAAGERREQGERDELVGGEAHVVAGEADLPVDLAALPVGEDAAHADPEPAHDGLEALPQLVLEEDALALEAAEAEAARDLRRRGRDRIRDQHEREDPAGEDAAAEPLELDAQSAGEELRHRHMSTFRTLRARTMLVTQQLAQTVMMV